MFRWLKTGLAGLTPEECDALVNALGKLARFFAPETGANEA